MLQKSVRAVCDRWEGGPVNLPQYRLILLIVFLRQTNTCMYMFPLLSQLTLSTSSASALCHDVFTKFDSHKA